MKTSSPRHENVTAITETGTHFLAASGSTVSFATLRRLVVQTNRLAPTRNPHVSRGHSAQRHTDLARSACAVTLP